MSQQLFIQVDGKSHGPYTPKQVREFAEQGDLLPTDLISFDQQKWGLASGLKGLAFPENPSAMAEGAKTAGRLGKAFLSRIQGAAEKVGSKVSEINADRVAAKEQKSIKLAEKLSDFGRFLNDEQDPKIIEHTVPRILQFLTSGEELLYVAIQKKPVANIAPDCIALTSKRIVLFAVKLLGQLSFSDFLWRDVEDATMQEGLLGATFSVKVANGKRITVDYIPKTQARALYRYAQEMEEHALEERRNRMMEERRAAAGGVVVQNAFVPPEANRTTTPTQPVDDPVESLRKLKTMLDADLITADEYTAKKAEILKRM